MQQEMHALVRLVFSADARESLAETTDHISDDLSRLFDHDSGCGVECVGYDIVQIREESDIYSNTGRADVVEAARAVLAAWESGDLAAAMRRLDGALYGDMDDRFNCCEGGQEPNWAAFDAIEVHPISTGDDGEGGTVTSLLDDENDPAVTGWCVYGHLRDGGGLEDITDVDTRARADELAREFSRRIKGAAR